MVTGTLTTRSTAAKAGATARETSSRGRPRVTFAITSNMATNDSAFGWLRAEIAAIRSRRFHIFSPVSAADLEYRRGRKKVRLRGAFASFLKEFGWALLYTDYGDAPLVSAYPLSSKRRFILADGQAYIGFGYRDEESVFFLESQVLTAGVSPVFAERQGHVVMLNEGFEQWLRESCTWARSTFSKPEWRKIVSGPKPFSPREQQIVAARTRFTWRHVGFEKNGDAVFEVSNRSDMTLPYLSIGVQGRGGTKLEGGVWLEVARIKPGHTGRVRQDCYKDQLSQRELECFALDEPIPEKKERYWEFERMKTVAKRTQPKRK